MVKLKSVVIILRTETVPFVYCTSCCVKNAHNTSCTVLLAFFPTNSSSQATKNRKQHIASNSKPLLINKRKERDERVDKHHRPVLAYHSLFQE